MRKYSLIQSSPQNDPKLVVALKLLLNATPSGWRRPLPLDGRLDAETLRRVTSLSTLNSYGERLGTVGIRTFVGLARQVGTRALAAGGGEAFPVWLRSLISKGVHPSRDLPDFDVTKFLQLYEENFKIYLPKDDTWKTGLLQFLKYLRDDREMTDVRWLSYVLASAMHESRSGQTGWKALWQPVEEYQGDQRSYGKPQAVTGWDENPIDSERNPIPAVTDAQERRRMQGKLVAHYNRLTRKTAYYPKDRVITRSYYGRGFIQITHQDNYRAMDEALGLNGRLHLDPDYAVQDAQVSYNVLSYGMRNGSFRGKRKREVGRGFVGGYKLADFLNESKTDYVAARDIVNGARDKADLIAGYAKTFEAMFQTAATR